MPNAKDMPIPAEMFTQQAERRVKLGLILAEIVKANGLDPHAYLTHVFEHLPRARTEDAVRALLPQQLAMADITPLPQSC